MRTKLIPTLLFAASMLAIIPSCSSMPSATEIVADASLALDVAAKYEAARADHKLTTGDYADIVTSAVDGYALAHPGNVTATNIQLWTNMAKKALKVYEATRTKKPAAKTASHPSGPYSSTPAIQFTYAPSDDLPRICATDPAEPTGYPVGHTSDYRIAFTTLASRPPESLIHINGVGSDESSSGSHSERP